jgi:hypothetical protein
VLEVGAASFSPPAALPLTPEQEKLAASVGRRIEARRAYQSKSYVVCGELQAALADEQRSSDDAFNAACCFARGGNADRAFTELARAVELGFKDVRGLEEDTDLAPLRGDPRWKALIGRLPK